MNDRHALSSERLAPIKELAERRESDAARALAEAQRALADREAQLHELENYKEPETPRGAPATQTAALLRNRESFRLRLAEAIRYQRQAVAEARKKVEAARAAWVNERCKTKVIEKLIERSEASELRVQERQQQREMDEFALRLLQAAPSSRSTG
jgi:flagellar FliJ protein